MWGGDGQPTHRSSKGVYALVGAGACRVGAGREGAGPPFGSVSACVCVVKLIHPEVE